MDPNDSVLEISSDEETGNEWQRSENFAWISELLSDVEREKDDDSSDDVVVVREVMATKHKLKSWGEEIDEDCVVLDGDPDKSVSVDDGDATSESDELVIVGEKGQIACRDYPHSRHLCVKFPFGSTPHETHCDQCHCFVCDSLAPCVYWGTGFSVGHCHATDKEELWKVERNNFKLRKSGLLQDPKFPDNSLSLAPPQVNQVSPLSQCNSLPPNQVSRPSTMRPCSTSTNFGVPNIISHGRSQRAGLVLPKNRFQPRLGSHQLLGVRSNFVRRERVQSIGNLGHQFVSAPSMFKRAGSVGGSYMANQSGVGSLNDINRAYAPQYARTLPPVATTINKNLGRCPDSHLIMNLESGMYNSSQSNANSISPNTVPLQPSAYSQPASQPSDHSFSQPNANRISPNPVPLQPLAYGQPVSQPNANMISPNIVPLQPSAYSQPASQPNDYSSSLTNADRILPNTVPLQPLAYSQLASQPNDYQNTYQLVNQTVSATDPSLPDFDVGLVDNTGPSNQQSQVENTQLQSAELAKEPSSAPDCNSQFPESVNPLFFDFEEWLMENQSVSEVSGTSFPYQTDMLSPQTAPIDTSLLCFDFETCWDGLTRA